MTANPIRDQAERLRLLTAGRCSGLSPRPEPGSMPADSRAQRDRPYVLAVASGKGGVGKTNIAANLAVALARRGLGTVVLDADLGLANVEVVLNCAASRNLGDVLLGEAVVEDVWAEGPAGVKVISAGSGADWLANLTQPQRGMVADAALAAARHADILVIDTAPGISADVTDFLALADEILIITTPEPTALADAYALVKTVVALGIRAEFELIVNIAPDRWSAERAARSIDTVCRKFLGRPIAGWDWLPFDPNVPIAVARQQPVVELCPSTGASNWLTRRAASTANRAAARERVSVR